MASSYSKTSAGSNSQASACMSRARSTAPNHSEQGCFPHPMIPPPLHSVPSLWLWHNYALFKDVHATILGTMIGCMIWKRGRIKEGDSRLFKWARWNHRNLWKKKREVTKENQNRRWWSRVVDFEDRKEIKRQGYSSSGPWKRPGHRFCSRDPGKESQHVDIYSVTPQSRILSCETIR